MGADAWSFQMTDLAPYGAQEAPKDLSGLSAERISFLRIIYMLPGLEVRRYQMPKSMLAAFGCLTNRNPAALALSKDGVQFLRDKGLDVFGRRHNDQHELFFRDRLATVQLLEQPMVGGRQHANRE